MQAGNEAPSIPRAHLDPASQVDVRSSKTRVAKPNLTKLLYFNVLKLRRSIQPSLGAGFALTTFSARIRLIGNAAEMARLVSRLNDNMLFHLGASGPLKSRQLQCAIVSAVKASLWPPLRFLHRFVLVAAMLAFRNIVSTVNTVGITSHLLIGFKSQRRGSRLQPLLRNV